MYSDSKTIMVVGGGAAGIQAALDLAHKGFAIHLVERSPTLGESFSNAVDISSTDPQVPLLYPMMVECARNPRIVLHTYSEVTGFDGSRGDFNVRILENARHVKQEKCIGCQACSDKCPVKVPDKVDARRGARKAIYMASPESIPRIVTIDSKNCLFFTKDICRVCEKFCTSNAIDFNQKSRETELKVAAIIVAPTLGSTAPLVFPDTRDAGIYRCQHPKERGPEDMQITLELGRSVASEVSQDMVGASGVAQVDKLSSIKPNGATAVVDPSRCDACGACESLCASGAPKVTSNGGQKICKINPMRCDGCGACVAGCPRFAISLQSHSDDQILDKIKMALNGGAGKSDEPRILMFTCKYCGFPITEHAGAWKTDYPENVRVVTLPCSGRLDPFIVAAALKEGADGIIISGCRPGYCHFLTGNKIAEQRYKILEAAMESLDAGPGRVRLQWISPSEPKPFTNFVKEMSEKLRALGPNPMRSPTEKSR